MERRTPRPPGIAELRARELPRRSPDGGVRGSTKNSLCAQLYLLNTTISASTVPSLTLSRATLTGNLNRRGPALPGLR